MKKDNGTQIMETCAEFLVQKLTDAKDGQTFAQEYLKAAFLSSAVDTLFHARHQAGLTQAQIAEQLKTKQAAIARLEADTDGCMSLHRYVEVALACGMVPLEISLVPIGSLCEYIIAHPEAARTQDAYKTWLTKHAQSIPMAGNSIQIVNKTTLPTMKTAITFQRGPASENARTQRQICIAWQGGNTGNTTSAPSPSKTSTLAQPQSETSQTQGESHHKDFSPLARKQKVAA